MPETSHGIVYPESGDHTRLWEHYQNLAESVDALLDGTTVSNPTDIGLVPDSRWSFGDFRAARFGPIITIALNVTYTGSTLTGNSSGNISDVSIATGLTSEWRPSQSVPFAFASGGARFGTGAFSTSGTITLQTLHAGAVITSGAYIIASIAYPSV